MSRAYARALDEILARDDDLLLINRRKLDGPEDVAEREVARHLAIEQSVLHDLINGRNESLRDDELGTFAARIERWTDEILDRFRRADRLDELRAMRYREYLRTPEWQERRQAALQRAGQRCQVCNAGDVALEVHHRTYERRGEERDEDLTVLCWGCHGLFHEHRDLAR